MDGDEKILVCGDLHAKYHIFEYVKSLAYKYDKVIFLGDYVDDWNTPPEASYNLLNSLIEWKKSEPDRVVLLWGNHDLSEYMPEIFRCAGFNQRTSDLVREVFRKNEHLFQIAYNWNRVLFTHAGLTDSFAKQLEIDDFQNGWSNIVANELNTLLDTEEKRNMLAQVGQARGGASIPSVIWADKAELEEDPSSDFIQVVGHTPVEEITTYTNDEANLIFCDTFSTYPNGAMIGNGSLLEIKFENNGLKYSIIETVKSELN